jgi:hypothetical protein
LDSNEHLSKFEELTVTLTHTREFAEKLKLENTRLNSDNAHYRTIEKEFDILVVGNKKLEESEKLSKKKELELTQKLQQFIQDTSDSSTRMEDQIAILNKVSVLSV